MKTITFFNNKGGVGKTTTIVNLASYLSIKKEKKILLIDLDPQSNSTQVIISEDNWLKFYGNDANRKTIYDYFYGMDSGDATLEKHEIPYKKEENNYKIDLIPGHPKMSMIDDLMSKCWSGALGVDKGDLRKLNWLNQIKKFHGEEYDYIFIDVGPSLGALNRSILLNSDYFLTPMASDIFSMLGVENIASWMSRWMMIYQDTLENFKKSNIGTDMDQFYEKYLINKNVSDSSKFIGYSIQQYSKRKFASGYRPTQAYEVVISNIDEAIKNHLIAFKKEGIDNNNLKLGDIPYVYSIIPLSQTSNTPIFELTYKSGLRGNQTSSVSEYAKFIDEISINFMRNVGDISE